MPSWTAASEVRIILKSGTPMTDIELGFVLDLAENYWKNHLKLPSTFTYSAPKHLMLKEACLLRACLYVIQADPASFRTLDEATQALDVIRDMYSDVTAILNRQDTSTFLVDGD